MDMAQIASVIPQDTMTVEISVDELDLHTVTVGMPAEVKINALGGEKFTAVVTSISNIGTNDGGSSKFPVILTMDRRENMLSGMNASVNLVLNTTVDTLTIPANALVEVGARTIVYTGYDEKNGILIDPVEVTTGISDGNTVQILDGLSEGDTYYYAYYDTLEISNTPNFGGGMMPGK
jgi:HlyD family secretion protein